MALDRAAEGCARTADEAKHAGAQAVPLVCDVTDANGIIAAAGETLKAFGRCDVLVNNAGILRPGDVATVSLADWNALMQVNPGETDQMAIEIFATDAVLQPGHRLRVTISSGDVPHIMTTTPVTLNTVGAVNTVHRGKSSPSFLTATVAPLGPEPATASASPRARAHHRAARKKHHRRRRHH